jgi:dipeptidyl-peptidase 4
MKNIIAFIILISTVFNSYSQQNFTMQEAVLGISTTLAPANFKGLQWRGNNALVYSIGKDTNEKWVQINIPNGSIDTLSSAKEWRTLMSKNNISGSNKLPALTWLNNTEAYFVIDSTYYLLNINKQLFTVKKLYSIPASAEHTTMHAATKNLAFVYNYNLYCISTDGALRAITQDGSANLLYGTSVHRDEFGIDGGIFWSNDGAHLAYYKMDQSMVKDYPIIDWKAIPATVRNIKYPFAGDTSHQVSLNVYHLSNNTNTKIITPGPADQYLTSVGWASNNEALFIGVLNRFQKYYELNKYNANTGNKINTITTEQSTIYVEPQHSLMPVPNKPNDYIYWSNKSGYTHLYLYNDEKKNLKQITQGSYNVNEILGYNQNNSELIISSSKDDPREKNIYAVDIYDNTFRKLSNEGGVHRAICNSNASYVLDVYNNNSIPRNIEVLAVEGDYEKRLLTANNTLNNYNVAQVKPIQLNASDGTLLYGKLIVPHNFDANKKYPVIVYLYNGPHIQLNTNSWPASGNLWYDYLTQQGYIVWVMDGRGSGNRGLAFEQATHLKLGTIEMEDQLVGINYLKQLAYIDSTRMGMHGWSFGGFMTTSFMLRQPNIFKVAVAGGPVMDWSKYEIMYTERYMSTPADNKQGYEDNNLLTKTKNLKGKLLIIHGTDDDVVVLQHSQLFIKNCVDNGIPIDYFNYVGHPHNVRGKDRVHLMQKITDYFNLHLKP